MNRKSKALFVGIPLMLSGAAFAFIPIMYFGSYLYLQLSNFVSKTKGESSFYLGPFVRLPSGREIAGTELLIMGMIGAAMIYFGIRQLRNLPNKAL